MRTLLTLLLAALASAAWAQDCTLDTEPNDTPAQANTHEDRTCIVGEIGFDGDTQDAYFWEVDEADAATPWRIGLEGIEGQLTRINILRITFADNGVDVTAADDLWTWVTPDGRRTESGPFLIGPGRYLVGFSTSGGSGQYVAEFMPGESLSRGRDSIAGTDEVEGRFGLHGTVEESEGVSWTLDEEEAAFRWGFRMRASLGDGPRLVLEGPDGTIADTGVDADQFGRLDGLGLEPGSYELRVEGAAGVVALDAERQGQVTDGNEVEPNNGWGSANLLSKDAPLEGVADDDDYFLLEIDEDEADTAWDVTIEATGGLSAWFVDPERNVLQERSGSTVEFHDLVLEPGSYGLGVASRDTPDYTIEVSEASLPEEGFEREPNDRVAGASPLAEDGTVRGVLRGAEADSFHFEVEGEARLWRAQVIGNGVEELALLDARGRTVQDVGGSGRIRLDNVQLLAGDNFVRVEGDGGEYALRVMDLGPAPEPDPEATPEPDEPLEAAEAGSDAEDEDDEDAQQDAPEDDAEDEEAAAPEPPPEPSGPPPPPGRMEREPNDDRSRSELLRGGGEVRVGTHASDRDSDYYRFYLPHDQYVRIEAVPPEGGRIRFDVDPGMGRARPVADGGPTVMERWMPAGDYFVETWDDEASGGFYQLRMRTLDPIAVPVDEEPNEDRSTARRVPRDLRWEGVAGQRSDGDYFRLPRFESETTVTARLQHDGDVDATLYDADGDRLQQEALEDGGARATLPAEQDAYLWVDGFGRYEVGVEHDGTPLAGGFRPEPGGGRAELTLEAPETEVTAYWHEGQRVEREVVVTNRGDAVATFELTTRSSDASVDVEAPAEVRVDAGASERVPVVAVLPPDVRDDQPVTVTVGARTEGSVDTTSFVLQPRCEAPPVGSRPHWSVPDPLLGGLNLAGANFGARVVGEEQEDAFAALFDGRTAPSRGVYRAAGESIEIELPGDEPVELVGTLLHPQSSGRTGQQLGEFTLEVSDDGETYETVIEGTLDAARIEQAFPFDGPVEARYARLTFVDNVAGAGGRVYLGEWKLVSAPERQPGSVNVAEPAHGGYVAWSRPLHGSSDPILTPQPDDVGTMDVEDIAQAEWVIGFHHQRAARLTRLEWVESPEADEDEVFDEVRVAASTAGPAGPWRDLGTWELERDASGTAALTFDEPVWARNLRFQAIPGEEQEDARPPGVLRAFEAPVDEDYRSILGEWGHYRREAVLEWTTRDDAPLRRLGEDDNDDMNRAYPLEAGERLEGSVLVAEDEDWYRLTLPEGDTELRIDLRGDPSIGYEYELMDADGEPVFFEIERDGYDVTLRAYPDPGEYYLRMWEPKRSVVFAWDTSGSVSPYQAITYNSLAGFARDVDPDREFVQMLAFDNPEPIWLLPYWSGDPARVQSAINSFDRDAASSNSEQALLVAANALADRDGTRAVLFMTDAESPGYQLTGELWAALSEAQPRIFTFEISTAGSDYSQDLMQSWAAVNQGYYDYARNVADFDVGFARASCHLRRPKRYEVEVATSTEPPPGPGSIAVRRGEGVPPPAVEVIFDASGSMGSELPNGVPRIDAAKDVLRDLVTDILPEGTSFAFRAFGHIEPQSCETRLDVPLTPLDPAVAREAFDAIQPKLLSQTPIAESLRQVQSDLAEAGEDRAVVLITDGEESCGGDPEAALAELKDAGVDVQLSIVSLALDDAEARERFARLAELGGGTYTDVTDRESLRASVEAAMNPAYQVLDAEGEVVATGQVGGPALEVPMGVYTVRVPGDPPELIRDVRVPGDSNVSLTVGGP